MTARQIIRAHADRAGVPVDEFLSSLERADGAVYRRHDAMRDVREHTRLSLPQIGRLFGRHHTTVLYGIRESRRRR